jgi:proteasome accessory factor C
MLPWLMERDQVPVAEMAAHFGLSEDALVADLELAAMCGLPPYLDELIDLYIDEGMIHVGAPRLFTRPLRLTAPEALALVANAEAAASIPGLGGDEVLAQAVAKVKARLGARVAIDIEPPPFTDAVRRAVDDGAVLAISYWVPRRDEVTEREIVPQAVYELRGDFYVDADDQRSGDSRTFRIDRIESCRDTGRRVQRRVAPGPPAAFFVDDEVDLAVLVVAADVVWMVDRYPVRERRTRPDGRIEVVLPVVDPQWLGRLLLRLGPDAEVASPSSWADLGARTAATVLARYRAGGSAAS